MTKARNLADNALSTVSPTELGFLDGVTSAVQTQIDGKTGKSTLTTTGDIYYASAANTPARLAIGSTSDVLTVAGGIPSWAAPAGGGKVLQVVHQTFTTQTTTTSATYADLGLTATITPSSASSKVLLFASVQSSKTSDGALGLKYFRGATEISMIGNEYGFTGASSTIVIGSVSISALDSPNTTSATTYKFQFNNEQASGTTTVNPHGGDSSLTLMEIGA